MFEVVNQDTPYGAKLITHAAYNAGDLIWRFRDYTVLPAPAMETIQIGRDAHIANLGVLRYLNHSCRPNTHVDTTQMACFAATPIEAGAELNFFYPSTEWDLSQPFVCLCSAPECIRLVVGARYLPLDVLSRYFINRHIRELALECLEVAALPA